MFSSLTVSINEKFSTQDRFSLHFTTYFYQDRGHVQKKSSLEMIRFTVYMEHFYEKSYSPLLQPIEI